MKYRLNGRQNSIKIEKGDFKKSHKKKRQTEANYQILNQLYNQTMELRNRVESERSYVDPNVVFKGLDYYRFLIESLPPASIPGITLEENFFFFKIIAQNTTLKMFHSCQHYWNSRHP